MIVGVLLAVAVVLATQYGYVIHVPFINDDYVFLDKTRAASFGSLWLPRQLLFQWYRPWSRELHYWALQRLFGYAEPAWHAVSFALLLGVAAGYAALARRLAGVLAATIATAGLFAMAAWGVPAVWIAGVQDLWMLLFCLLALWALDAGRVRLAVAACALALLSKETAAMLPPIATAFVLIRRRQGVIAALRETAGMWTALLAWALAHPQLGGRLWHAVAPAPSASTGHSSWPIILTRTLLSLVNLDAVPRPEGGWPAALLRGLPGALALAAIVAWALVATRRGAAREVSPAGVVAAGMAWAILGWLPLLAPSLGWHAYYGLFGACGAWLVLGVALARRPVPGVALVALLAGLRSAQAATPSLDWGSEFYQQRSALFLSSMRADLLRLHPSVMPSSRMYFALVPSQVGFLTGDAPVLRVWYGDPTLRGGYFGQYLPREPDGRGRDYFFRYDARRGWIEIPADSAAVVPPGDPDAIADVGELGVMFSRAGDWRRAAIQFERLARAAPGEPKRAVDAGATLMMAGDTVAAIPWLERALGSPRLPDSLRDAARDMLDEARPGAVGNGPSPPPVARAGAPRRR